MAAPRILTPEQVRYIRECARIRKETPSGRQLARQFKVRSRVVADVARGITYKEIR
jgi:hypothetical protein